MLALTNQRNGDQSTRLCLNLLVDSGVLGREKEALIPPFLVSTRLCSELSSVSGPTSQPLTLAKAAVTSEELGRVQ